MKRIEFLQNDPLFLEALCDIESDEAERVFCRHGLPHLLDVARIAWIDVLERGLEIDKAVVYAAALLHDLGRAGKFPSDGGHSAAALSECREMLLRSGFGAPDTEAILRAIADHGDKQTPDSALPPLSAVIRRADRLSRPCWHCAAADTCYWTPERRNLQITV